jgi:hypothetical protein
MTPIEGIVRAVERLGPADFLRLRTALDKVEEKLWHRELARAAVRHRKRNLTDAKIDALIEKRRSKGRRS